MIGVIGTQPFSLGDGKERDSPLSPVFDDDF
jgi:hypothetical protein